MRGGEKCLSSRRVGKREGSKLVEAVEAGGECMLLPSGTDREELDPVEVLSAGGECKFLNGSWYRVGGENNGGKVWSHGIDSLRLRLLADEV
jgi:hypothetical protein